MKKLLFLISMACATVTAVSAQGVITTLTPTAYQGVFTSDLTVHAAGKDTSANTASVSQVLQISGSWGYVTIQAAVVKLSGNPTLGSVKLYGSTDGVKYDYVTTAIDSLAITNQSAVQVHTWRLTGNPFVYYKATCKGGNGATQTTQLTTSALARK